MEIDWLTVTAQVVNFLVLVYLLKRFLYRPVTEAMARREERIAERVREGREREEQAEQERQRLHRRLEKLEERRDAILGQAREEAEEERRRLLEEAREEAEGARRRWREQADTEKDHFLEELRRRTCEGFQELARKALEDLAEADLEEQMVRTFLERLQGLDKETRRRLSESDEPVAVATSFALDSGGRRRVTRAIHEHLKSDVEVEYEESPNLLCGIELTAGGRRLGWSLTDYLDRFEARVGEALGPGRSARTSDEDPSKNAVRE
jgi:F-type H+-transporting ATPase subunit b